MKFADQIERLQYLNKLIQKGATGTPSQLAERLGISRSQLYNIIGYLNDIGMNVKFSRTKNSFYYDCPEKDLNIQFSIKVISGEKAHTIYGGSIVLRDSNLRTSFTNYDQVNC